MHYRIYDIDPLLQPFVKVICSVENDSSIGSPAPVRVLPDASVELFVNFCEPQQVAPAGEIASLLSRSFITSRMNKFMTVRTHSQVGFVSVWFFDGSAYPFFPVSMHDVTNQAIDLRELWGRSADEMQDRVDKTETTAQRVQLIQQYLIAQLRKFGQPDAGIGFCIGQINRTNGQLSLEDLANRTGITNRHLVRRFNQCIGLSPKEFARIITFRNALKHLKKYPSLSLTEIAYESGYYDQAHFIRACRDHAGLTPGQLIATSDVLY
ncbi:helix-turn-helix domain-containing protein [Spirosoma validum]|uniref:AraC family transcriptional regulator n=1 Tax=Spirosoma validum TaxID=2771355 RepID=A0A927B1F4_9BACT|nr:helix-turn-helix domain-containing protein [Spirosoma validum]MBD2753492.1 AraC family transcriptional regulator [Spirosoma validum]